MNTHPTSLEPGETLLSSEDPEQALRKDLTTGLALARRSLVNAKRDIATGLNIDPEPVDKLERIVADYIKMLAAHDRKSDTEL